MRKIKMAINVTPEGFCDHRPVVVDDELYNFYNGLMKNGDTELFGRKTFQLMESYWPGVAKNNVGTKEEIEFAHLLDDIQKIVFSKAGIDTNWKNTTVLNEIKKDEILKLKQQPGKDIFTGSPSIVDQLTALGVIDEYYFVVQPIISGNGKRFFETQKLQSQVDLRLNDTKIFNSGVIVLHYSNPIT